MGNMASHACTFTHDACMYTIDRDLCAQPPPPTSGHGKFYYKNGATYVGDWMLLFPAPPPTPEGGDKKVCNCACTVFRPCASSSRSAFALTTDSNHALWDAEAAHGFSMQHTVEQLLSWPQACMAESTGYSSTPGFSATRTP